MPHKPQHTLDFDDDDFEPLSSGEYDFANPPKGGDAKLEWIEDLQAGRDEVRGCTSPNATNYNPAATKDEFGKTKSSYSLRVPYYINLAPDRDLLVALNYMSSRRFI